MTGGFRLEGRQPGTTAFGTRQRFPVDSDARLPLDKRIVAARGRAERAKLAWQASEPTTEFRIVDDEDFRHG